MDINGSDDDDDEGEVGDLSAPATSACSGETNNRKQSMLYLNFDICVFIRSSSCYSMLWFTYIFR